MCHGEPCTILIYSFTWKNEIVKKATGDMIDPRSGKHSSEDILGVLKKKLETSDSFLWQKVNGKAEEQEKKTLRRKIKKVGTLKYQIIDAACGEDAGCICVQIKGSSGTKLEKITKTFEIKDLDGSEIKKDTKDCVKFSIEIEVEVEIELFDGRCIPLSSLGV